MSNESPAITICQITRHTCCAIRHVFTVSVTRRTGHSHRMSSWVNRARGATADSHTRWFCNHQMKIRNGKYTRTSGNTSEIFLHPEISVIKRKKKKWDKNLLRFIAVILLRSWKTNARRDNIYICLQNRINYYVCQTQTGTGCLRPCILKTTPFKTYKARKQQSSFYNAARSNDILQSHAIFCVAPPIQPKPSQDEIRQW